jgi:four helix bundle protein
MARPKSFRELIVWQKAMELARATYQTLRGVEHREARELLWQARRAAVSVPSNIAEGYGRLTDLQFRHFLGNARGSLYELQTQLELACDLGFLNEVQRSEIAHRSAEVARLINGLLASLSRTRKRLEEADAQDATQRDQ